MTRTTTSLCALCLLAPVLLGACTTTSLKQAPIIERSARRDVAAAPLTQPASPPATRAAHDGFYTVQRGDTLYSIALAFGVDYRELAHWNGLDDPTKLQVGQSLRVQAPSEAQDSGAVAAVPVAPIGAPEVRPLDGARPLPPLAADTTPPVATSPAPAVTAPAPPPVARAPESKATPPAAPVQAEPATPWLWPASGKVIEVFEEPRSKGIDIAGAEGDPVLAANDGQVVYSGSGLRGYGNLVIIKHTEDFISAYAHNRQILVKHGQEVKRGQRIAEMGKSDADIPKLHFEVRRQGKPVDPLKYLPAR